MKAIASFFVGVVIGVIYWIAVAVLWTSFVWLFNKLGEWIPQIMFRIFRGLANAVKDKFAFVK